MGLVLQSGPPQQPRRRDRVKSTRTSRNSAHRAEHLTTSCQPVRFRIRSALARVRYTGRYSASNEASEGNVHRSSTARRRVPVDQDGTLVGAFDDHSTPGGIRVGDQEIDGALHAE